MSVKLLTKLIFIHEQSTMKEPFLCDNSRVREISGFSVMEPIQIGTACNQDPDSCHDREPYEKISADGREARKANGIRGISKNAVVNHRTESGVCDTSARMRCPAYVDRWGNAERAGADEFRTVRSRPSFLPFTVMELTWCRRPSRLRSKGTKEIR